MTIYMSKYSANKYWIDNIIWQQKNSSSTPVPTGFGGQLEGDIVRLGWTATDGATYNIYRGTTIDNETLLMGDLSLSSYNDSSITIEESTTYYYQLTATVNGIESGKTSPVNIITIVPTTDLLATDGLEEIVLTWSAAGGAVEYAIGRSTSSGDEELLTVITDITYTDTDVDTFVTYYYEIIAENSSGFGPLSNESSAQAVD